MNIKKLNNRLLPIKRASEGAVAFDIPMMEDGVLLYGETNQQSINLGFSLEVPSNMGLLLLPRSGVGSKKGLHVANTIGLIDPDYRGPITAVLRNFNKRAIEWSRGDCLVQMFLFSSPREELNYVDELGETLRGSGGFGSTGN